jgi:hypothetical protein
VTGNNSSPVVCWEICRGTNIKCRHLIQARPHPPPPLRRRWAAVAGTAAAVAIILLLLITIIILLIDEVDRGVGTAGYRHRIIDAVDLGVAIVDCRLRAWRRMAHHPIIIILWTCHRIMTMTDLDQRP